MSFSTPTLENGGRDQVAHVRQIAIGKSASTQKLQVCENPWRSHFAETINSFFSSCSDLSSSNSTWILREKGTVTRKPSSVSSLTPPRGTPCLALLQFHLTLSQAVSGINLKNHPLSRTYKNTCENSSVMERFSSTIASQQAKHVYQCKYYSYLSNPPNTAPNVN